MKKVFQALNPRTKAWTKIKTLPDGMTKILDVKQREPSKPFKGIRKK